MNASTSHIEQAAAALRGAREQRVPIPRVSETFGIAGLEAAYAVARQNSARAQSDGRVVSGKKIGLTSKAVQQQLGVDQPDYGVLFKDMEYLDAAEVEMGKLIQPKAEGEIALVIGRDLDAQDLTWGRFLHGLEYALPAIEIVDSAIIDWKITLVDTIADNASCGVYVLGVEPRRIGDLSLADCAMDFHKNGERVSSGNGAACLGNPLLAAFWLAQTMAAFGEPLKAGDVVMSGALGPMFPITRGDALCVEMAGLGKVRCQAV